MERHPVFYSLVKARVRLGLRRQGLSFRDVGDAMDACDEAMIDAAAGPPMVWGTGDGTIIGAVLEFLKSEQGQQIIAALVKALLALLAV